MDSRRDSTPILYVNTFSFSIDCIDVWGGGKVPGGQGEKEKIELCRKKGQIIDLVN